MKRFTKIMTIAIILLQIGTTTVFADANGTGSGSSWTDTVNVNDYSTTKSDRFSYNYQFKTDPDYQSILGHPTETTVIPRNKVTENVARNKDVSKVPPPYGAFSGEFDTEQSNPYVTVKNYQYAKSQPVSNDNKTYDTLGTGINGMSSNGMLPSTSLTTGSSSMQVMTNTQSQNTSLPPINTSNVTVSTIDNLNTLNTQVKTFSDGSMGTISIPKIDVNVKVWDGGTLENMKKGVAHFSFTSAWDGNVGIAGHNGGTHGYFENIKNLVAGDTITYTTTYGTRTYVVNSSRVISDTDFSTLGSSTQNQLTLLTCERGVPNERFCLIAVEQ